jgi:endonuclease YncB( thermonuclease family)
MLTRFIVLLVLFGALGVFGQDAPTPVTYTFGLEHVCIHGRITGVVDGDTINVLILGKQQIRVRLAFVDAPERGQAFGQRAKAAISELVFGKGVKLRPHTIDRQGRLVARVLVDNQDAGLELLKQGLCWVYEKYVGEASAEIRTSYHNAQDAAQSERVGLWQDTDPIPPWEWRKVKHVSRVYVGNFPEFCRWRVTYENANSLCAGNTEARENVKHCLRSAHCALLEACRPRFAYDGRRFPIALPSLLEFRPDIG